MFEHSLPYFFYQGKPHIPLRHMPNVRLSRKCFFVIRV